jgi:hypothetical protein
MKNWKTTLFGIVAALPYILKIFGINIPHEITDCVTGGGLLGMGFMGKDKNVTGGSVKQ